MMMNLHAKSCICGYVMFLFKIDEEWSCGCFGTCCWWIDIMGIPICELVMRIVVVVEKLWKFGELLNLDEMMF